MGRQCAEAQLVADDANVSELVQAADVDQSFDRSEAEIEHWDQALPTGENLGLFSEPGESRECRFQISRTLVFKRCSFIAADLLVWSAYAAFMPSARAGVVPRATRALSSSTVMT
jgi:hypothetical protein